MKSKYLLSIILLIFNLIFNRFLYAQYRIGVSLPLTGDLAEYGSAVQNGISLARGKFPSKLSNVEFLYEDNRYEARASVDALKKLQTNSIDILFSWGEVPINATARIVENRKIPTLVYSLDSSNTLGSSYITRISNDAKSLTAPLADVLHSRGYKKIGIVKMEDSYINACIDGLKANLTEDQKIEIISTILPGEVDMKIHALQAVKSDVEIVGVYLYPGQISSFYKALSSYLYKKPTFGTDIFESKTEISLSGPAINNAIYPNFKLPDYFYKEYTDSFKNDAEISYAYNAYAWAVITAYIVNAGDKKLTAKELVSAYRAISSKETDLNFKYKETEDGDHFYEFPIVVKEISEEHFRERIY